MTLIKVKNLKAGYDNKVIIKNISFEINEGDYICIYGNNGTGKSTLIKTILNLQRKLDGVVEYCEGLTHYDFGYLSQQKSYQNDFPASVWEVVLSGCVSNKKFHFFYNKKDKEKAVESIKKLGITSLTKKGYSTLSGGQKQRVLLARALCATNKILFLDEPIVGLDAKTTRDFYKIIKELNNSGVAIVMISHDIKNSIDYANKVVNLGDQIFVGKPDEFIAELNIDLSQLKEGGNN